MISMTEPERLEAGLEPYPGYRLEQFLARGSFGEVWEARTADGKAVALKFLACKNTTGAATENQANQIVRQLRHPNLIRIYNVWSQPGYLVVAMELAEGSLHDLLTAYHTEHQTPIPRAEVCRLLTQAAVGIDFLNARQHILDGQRVSIQHCDIKPSNLLVMGETVKLSDFSLTSVTTASVKAHRRAGTPEYMAPEVFQGQLSEWTDQYALAVTYCLLRSGRLPFTNLPATIRLDYVKQAPDLSMLPERERRIIARALAPVPQDRWHSCGELIAELSKLKKDSRTSIPIASLRNSPADSRTARPGVEERTQARYLCSVTISWRLLGAKEDKPWPGRVHDISRSGISVVINAQFKFGTILAVKLENGIGRLTRPILVRVVHTRKQTDGTWLHGCVFLSRLTDVELRLLLE